MVATGPAKERKEDGDCWSGKRKKEEDGYLREADKAIRWRTEVQGRAKVGSVKGKNCWERTCEIFLPNILIIKNKVEDSLGILYQKKKSGAYTNFGVQIARNEKVLNQL